MVQFTDNQKMPDTIGLLLNCPTDAVCLSAQKAKYTGRTTIADLLLNAGKTFTVYADGYAAAVAFVLFIVILLATALGTHDQEPEDQRDQDERQELADGCWRGAGYFLSSQRMKETTADTMMQVTRGK